MYLKVHHIDFLWSLAGSSSEFIAICDLFYYCLPLEVLNERMKLAYQVDGAFKILGSPNILVNMHWTSESAPFSHSRLASSSDNAYCSIKHIMLSIFLVKSATIVVYRLLFLGLYLYCFSLTVCFCFCFPLKRLMFWKVFERKNTPTRAEFTMTTALQL